MTQATDWSVPIIGPATPTTMADRMDKSLDALLSAHSGSARPAYAVAGTEWVSTATAGKLKYYVFDGAADRLTKTIDITTGSVIYSNGTVDDALATKAPISAYAAKSSGYTAVAADAGKTLRFTAAATLALTAAATLGNGWKINVVADGGAVTIDPNASETINGLTTLIVPNGSSAEIICDGSNFITVIKPFAWEVIQDSTISAASSFAVTNLGAYKRLRISGFLIPSTPAAFYLQTSTNNGSSYDSGASDYITQFDASSSASVNAQVSTSTIIPMTTATTTTAEETLNVQMERFNQAARCLVLGTMGFDTGTLVVGRFYGIRNQNTARNAFRIIPSAGTMTGYLTVEGMRG